MGSLIIDNIHSTIGFEVTHMMVSKVRGEFESYRAKIETNDVDDFSNASFEITIDANSITTRFKERDNHLKSADFFDVHRFPYIEFTSTEIRKKEEEGKYTVIGDLTIKETTKVVIFDVSFIGKATDLSGQEVYGFVAESTINREDFGLLWNQVLETGGVLVGKEVTIKVDLELKKESDMKTVTVNLLKNNPEKVKEQQKLSKTDYYQLITENMTDIVLLINREGTIKYATPSVQHMLGYEHDFVVDRNFFEAVHPEDQKMIKEQIQLFAKRTIKSTFKIEFRLQHQDGHYIVVETDVIYMNEHELVQIVIRDISDKKEQEKAIYKLAFYDSLTKLPNRRSLLNKLRNEVITGRMTDSKFSVLFIDLDNFKPINDTLGHDAGDIALKEAAKRIRSVIRPTDVAARYGGDEFVVLLRDIPDEQQTITIAKRILKQFDQPITELGRNCSLTPSIGVAHYPEHGESPEELIKNADTALYQVKEQGKNNFMIFDKQMEHQSLERRILENALRKGLKEEQFYLVYQPKVNITTNEVIGMEALVRWSHPELGVIPPLKFIPLAEETGLIIPLGEWILREACRQAVAWEKEGYPALHLSVNISVHQFEDVHFVDKLKTILKETGLDPQKLELEITESVLADIKSTLGVLKEIKELGVLISVDDFGTGYSSLSYIKELPIDTIKIDQSFIKDIHENRESKEIARALINLADSMGLHAIAEGIEQKEHVKQLKQDGYTFGQGYYYSRPLDATAFKDFMAQKKLHNEEKKRDHPSYDNDHEK